MLVKRMSAREARNNFSDVLGSVYYSKEAIIVEKQGRPFAVVISVDDYEQLLEERRARFAVLDEIRAKNREVSPDEAEKDSLREIAALRQDKRLKRTKA